MASAAVSPAPSTGPAPPLAMDVPPPAPPDAPAAEFEEAPTTPGAALEQVTSANSEATHRTSYSSMRSARLRPSLTRRTSLEEDYFYREVMTVPKKPTEPPPSYESTMKRIRRKEREEAATAAAKAAVAAAAATASAAAAAVTEAAAKEKVAIQATEKAGKTKRKSRLPSYKGKEKAPIEPVVTEINLNSGTTHAAIPDDVLPAYSCDIHMEGVFQRKMEIENATKRAEDRRWSAAYVVLHGTALEVYDCRKNRTWAGRTGRAGPCVSPDQPPWLRKAALEKSYNLSYADVGIAADYVKRRYVIRVRAETDQFLLACIELETFVSWLDAFFAALSIAAPIDERDFPRDQSIPRLQRIRWYHGRDREAEAARDREREEERTRESERESDREVDDGGPSSGEDTAATTPDARSPASSPSMSRAMSPSRQAARKTEPAETSVPEAAADVLAEEMRRSVHFQTARLGSVSSSASSTSVGTASSASTVAGPSSAPLYLVGVQQRAAARAMLAPITSSSTNASGGGGGGSRFSLRAITSRLASSNSANAKATGSAAHGAPNVLPPTHDRYMALSSRPGAFRHEGVDLSTGKWQPRHRWTKTHDMVYAKLCYATLLFRSPRKSNYIIMKGKQWLVDWTTGNMVRVNPPFYGEIEMQPGPWQIMRTENARI